MPTLDRREFASYFVDFIEHETVFVFRTRMPPGDFDRATAPI